MRTTEKWEGRWGGWLIELVQVCYYCVCIVDIPEIKQGNDQALCDQGVRFLSIDSFPKSFLIGNHLMEDWRRSKSLPGCFSVTTFFFFSGKKSPLTLSSFYIVLKEMLLMTLLNNQKLVWQAYFAP